MPPVPGGVSRLHLTDRELKPSLIVPRDADSIKPIKPPVTQLVEDATDKLFQSVLHNPVHTLYRLLPERRHDITDSLRITRISPLLKSPPTESPLQFHRLAIHRLLNSPTSYYTADKLHRLVNLRHDEISAAQSSVYRLTHSLAGIKARYSSGVRDLASDRHSSE